MNAQISGVAGRTPAPSRPAPRRLPQPLTQRLRATPQPRADLPDRGPLGVIVARVIADRPDRLGLDILVVLGRYRTIFLPSEGGVHDIGDDSRWPPQFTSTRTAKANQSQKDQLFRTPLPQRELTLLYRASHSAGMYQRPRLCLFTTVDTEKRPAGSGTAGVRSAVKGSSPGG
jgi:hypothetical protein